MVPNSNTIATVLGVSSIPTNTDSKQELIVVDKEDKAKADYEYARQNLYDIIEQGQHALDDMVEFAKQAQHPRAYEVVGGLINNLVDANERLLMLNEKIKKIKKEEAESDNSSTVNNNLFVGSTSELLKLLKGE